MTTGTEGIAPVQPSRAKTLHDGLPWPGGGTLGDVDRDLTRQLVGFGIPGASHEQGRSANAEAYARHLERLRTEAAEKAVAAWLAEAAAK